MRRVPVWRAVGWLLAVCEVGVAVSAGGGGGGGGGGTVGW